MKQHLLLTKNIKAKMPEAINTLYDFGSIAISFPAKEGGEKPRIVVGNNAVLEGKQSDFVNWLEEFDEVFVGDGVPQLENFTIMHIKDKVI